MEEAERRGVEWLRRGGRMLKEHCPTCNSPLFEVDGEVKCPGCGRVVMTVGERRSALRVVEKRLMYEVEETLVRLVREVKGALSKAKNLEEALRYSQALYILLASLDLAKRMAEEGGSERAPSRS